jgi:hypothetical protein
VVAKRRIFTLILLAAISLLAACGGSSSSSDSPSQAAVSIALNPAPSSTTTPVGNTTGIQFTPVVDNDPAENGVDWALTCTNFMPPAPNCGSLSICSGSGTCSMHSASGTAVTYIPPTDFAAGSLSVNLTAFATADHTKNVSTAVTVSSYAAALSGAYVFQVQGNDGGSNYQIMGVLVLDGNGNVTAGQETVNNLLGTTTPPFSTAYTLQPSSTAPSTYFIGSDGRGIITANFQPTNASSPVTPFTETFSLVVISSSEALIAENDENCAFNCPVPFGATGFGTLELQAAAAASTMPSGAYAFVTNGTDSGSSGNPLFGVPAPTAIGGIFNIDNNPSPGDISGNGSLADQDYYNSGLQPKLISCVPPTGLTGNVTQPSAMGVVTITLTGRTCFGTTTPATIQFAGYIVDSQHIRLIEIDDGGGSSGFLTSGIAVGQGTAAGTFTQASLSGAYVFGILGSDGATSGAASPATLTSVGTVIADGNGHLSGEADSFYGFESVSFTCPLPPGNAGNPGTACPPGTSGMSISGTYALDTHGSGGAGLGRANVGFRFSETGASGVNPEPTIIFYLTGNGTPPLLMYAGDSDQNYPAVGAGIAYPQPSAALLNFGNPETYAINFTQYNGTENDGSGAIRAQQNPQPPPQWEFTGTVDDTSVNELYSGGPPFSFSILDSFTPPADRFGRIGATFMNVPGSGTNGPFYAYYLVDDNQGLFIETDLATSTLPQTSLGYFAQACDVTSTTSCQQAASASRRAEKQAACGVERICDSPRGSRTGQ